VPKIVEKYQTSWDSFNKFHFDCDQSRFLKLFSRLELVKLISDIPGDIVDAGVYKGTSTIAFAHLLDAYQPNSRSKVIAFDSFSVEFPRAKLSEIKAVKLHQESYDKNAYSNLVNVVKKQKLNHRIDIIKGDIVKTFPKYLKSNPGFRISLLHCDLDTYEPTFELLRHGWSRLVKGGIAVFDEYAVGMWGESNAVDDFFATLDNPPKLQILKTGPTPTAYCVKL